MSFEVFQEDNLPEIDEMKVIADESKNTIKYIS